MQSQSDLSRLSGSASTNDRPQSSPSHGNKETETIPDGEISGFAQGIDIKELRTYTNSNEAPLYIGVLWYLNVHTTPPYRWQRSQALLYPHMLLVYWIGSNGGRAIISLDLLHCTGVQSAPHLTHHDARDDAGTVAARLQSAKRRNLSLMDKLLPFHMLYNDGIECLAAESAHDRRSWINRLWEAINNRAESIHTLLSIEDGDTYRSISGTTKLRSSVSLPLIDANSGDLARSSSFAASISPASSISVRIARPSTNSLKRKSTTDEYKRKSLGHIPSSSSIGDSIFVTPPSSVGRGSNVHIERFTRNSSSNGSVSISVYDGRYTVQPYNLSDTEPDDGAREIPNPQHPLNDIEAKEKMEKSTFGSVLRPALAHESYHYTDRKALEQQNQACCCVLQ